MLIARCAWHPRNYRYCKLLGVVSWRGLHIEFTDGICQRCATRIHPALVPRFTGGAVRPAGARVPAIVVVVLVFMTGLVFFARPSSDVAPPVAADDAPPREVRMAQAQAEPPPGPRAAAPRVRRPRPAETTPVSVRMPSPRHAQESP